MKAEAIKPTMKIVLAYQEDEYLRILHLTKEEENFMKDYDSDENMDLSECDRVEKILTDRGIHFDMFTPWYMVVHGNLPIFNDWEKLMISLR